MKAGIGSTFYHFFVIAFGFLMIYPILWTVASSLKPGSEIFTNVASLLPSRFMWDNYAIGWRGTGKIGFSDFFANSAVVTFFSVIGSLLSASLVGFGFARLQFKYRSFLFGCLLVTMMLPGQVTLIPQYILFQKIGWVNTYFPLTVPSFIGGTPFFIFLMVQFYRGIPRELDEAAVIDGCSTFGVWRRVVLPLCMPALTTVAIFSFLWTWDEFFAPLIYLNDPKLYTIALGLSLFSDPSASTEWGPLLAMSTLTLIPQFVIFMIFQKYIVEGIATTGIKG
ncbi:carbohydrate ABC transporter permease [Paenibacillus hodogayensis]|uniref:Carbohydrate ABC transporter permease n=1 Tax=Paenibacillus hodogayensis TaxID=279208 RepID=A0ABV5VXH0_9BACL